MIPQETLMTVWHWLTKKLPLDDDRDVMARIGFRYVWCTLPYFAAALGMAAFGVTTLLLSPLSVVPLVVPIAGGILDWWRVRRRPADPAAA
jgi:hypothetical protein